jgi:beta-barrel assembly-enhancing protease
VLGHELGHYLKRHALQMWRERRSRSAGAAIVAAMVSPALGGNAETLAQSAVAGSLAAFSRDKEREADELGLEAMAKAGYAPGEAARVWERLLNEEKLAADKGRSAFFAAHPPTEERLTALRDLAARTPPGAAPGTMERDALLAATGRLRATFLSDELQQRRFPVTQVLLDHLLAAGDRPAEVQFFRGELYRLRNEPGDGARAIAAYRMALALPDAPAETQRSLGVLLLRAGDRVGARTALTGYLERKPDADDAAMIRAQIRELE